jgi:hypothetical protein
MLLKNIRRVVAVALMLFGMPAFASVVVHLHEEFGSGAVYNGDLTFADNYTKLLSANGLLSGTGYGVPLAMNFVYLADVASGPGTLFGNDVSGHLNDWLVDVDTTLAPPVTHTMGIVWSVISSQLVFDLNGSNSGFPSDTYGTAYVTGITVWNNGALVASDAATLVRLGSEAPPQTNRVPEPGSVLLLGAGIAALIRVRRRKAA